GARPGAFVAEALDVYLGGIATGRFDGFHVKGFDDAVAVVFGDKVADTVGQAIAAGHFQSVGDVGHDDAGAAVGVEGVVGADAFVVFGEEGRPGHFAHVVIEGTDANEGAVGTDALGRLFGQVGDHDAVMIGSGGAAE